MHELSLAMGLVSTLEGLVREHGASRVIKARVGLGRRSGIVEESFRFGFDAVKLESPSLRGALLETIVLDGDDLILMQVEME